MNMENLKAHSRQKEALHYDVNEGLKCYLKLYKNGGR